MERRKGRGGRGGTNQSGELTLICTSCDSSWRVKFLICSASFSAFRSWVMGGTMWIGVPYLVYDGIRSSREGQDGGGDVPNEDIHAPTNKRREKRKRKTERERHIRLVLLYHRHRYQHHAFPKLNPSSHSPRFDLHNPRVGIRRPLCPITSRRWRAREVVLYRLEVDLVVG
jgi:hypothetical protein